MRLCRIGPPGAEVPALLDRAGRRRSLAGIVPDIDEAFFRDGGLERVAGLDPAALPLLPDDARYGPCIAPRGKIVCLGLNYRDHAAECGLPVPSEPAIFIKGCRASGPDDPIRVPRGAAKLDWEVELGVVIGRRADDVPPETALDHVAGFCVVHDVSERAFQHERGGQWTKGKSAEGFAPVGPWLATRDEVPDWRRLSLRLAVNGIRRQDGTAADMVFGVAEAIAHISRFMVLHPGDLVSTGTPAGVGAGRRPDPVYLAAGDVVELAITGLGTQRHPFR